MAATKYLSVAELGVLAEAGIEVVGENRAQDLEAKHAAHGDAFRWHFIGHLQSRKAKLVSEICELVHSLDSESAARRLDVPALLQVNLAGEASKSGVSPEEIPAFLELYPRIVGLRRCPRRRTIQSCPVRTSKNSGNWLRNAAYETFPWERARITKWL